MKFLPANMEGKNLMPIHVYYTKGKYGANDDDILDFVYKDIDTGKKYVESIRNPYYEIWVVKPEYRNYTHIKDFIKKEHCTCHKIHYKTRYIEASKILGLAKGAKVKQNPYLFQFDIQIEHFYLMQFKHEYANNAPKKVSLGFLDIESDMFQNKGKVVPGKDPINCVSYLHRESMTMYTLFLRQDFIPEVPQTNIKYNHYTNLRKKYYEQVDAFVADIDNYVKYLHECFDESYGVIDYKLFMFEKEIDLIEALFEIINATSPDYWFVWNLPYDEESLINAIIRNGKDPTTIISDLEMRQNREFYFRPDNNPKPQKRRHVSNIFSKSIPVDQLPLYAGVRVSRGSLQSMKLNVIAEAVLADKKLDYSEYSDFRYFCYSDFRKFITYNIKDVLLQHGIERIGNDILFLSDTICNNCVLNYEIFTTTTTECMAIRDFAFTYCGKVMGNNKNKMDLPEPSFSVSTLDGEDDLDMEDFMYGDEDSEEDEEEDDDKKKKKKKYSGAYVMSPGHISSSGTVLMGKENKYVHEHVIDQDIGAEYPTYASIANCNNEALVGKVYLLNEDDVKMPFCDNFKIIDAKDEEIYSKIKSSDWVMELWSEKDVLSFGNVVLGLPSPSEILQEIEDDIKHFAED